MERGLVRSLQALRAWARDPAWAKQSDFVFRQCGPMLYTATLAGSLKEDTFSGRLDVKPHGDRPDPLVDPRVGRGEGIRVP